VGRLPIPLPARDEALIEVRAAGTNPVEISMREGHFKLRFPFSFPQVIGLRHCGFGRLGTHGSAFKAGDEVYARYPTAGLVLMPNVAVVPLASWPANLRSS